MLPLRLPAHPDRPLSVLALGAHPDDIEIGAGGTLLTLAESQAGLQVRYVVLTGTPERQQEAHQAAQAFLPGARLTIDLHTLPDGRFPAEWNAVKEALEAVARAGAPDLILAPDASDAHQDHRTIAEIIPTVFRDSLYLAYEIPKWDGDMSRPSTSRSPRPRPGARPSCCTPATRRSMAGTGGTTRFSWAWPACAVWSAGPRTPRRFTAAKCWFHQPISSWSQKAKLERLVRKLLLKVIASAFVYQRWRARGHVACGGLSASRADLNPDPRGLAIRVLTATDCPRVTDNAVSTACTINHKVAGI